MDLEGYELALLEELRASNIRIPARPQILQEIQSMLDDETASDRMIAQMISRDVGLSAEIFKVSNSAAYMRAKKVESIESAVRILGRRAIGDVSRNVFLRRHLSSGAANLELFWERCTDIGTLCGVLCESLNKPGLIDSEQAYLFGLFHDCGVPVLMQHIKGYGVAQLRGEANQDFLCEDDTYRTSHCIAGLMVASEWQLPDSLSHVIRAHHYVIAESQPIPQAIALVQLAIHAYARVSQRTHDEWQFQQDQVLRTLLLSRDDAEQLIRHALESFDVLH